jgi:hypothetical protein
MALTIQQVLSYYSNLLIIQYNSLPKATQTIQALVNCNLCDDFFLDLQNAFNISTATGQQLTIIGKIVGVPRNIYGLDLVDTFFTFSNWTGQPASVGFNTWTTPTDTDKIASWLSTTVYTPTDFEMLALIRLKIMRNNYYTSLGKIIPALWNIFGSGVALVDNLNTSITYNFQSPYHNVAAVASFLGNICPKPMGVAITINQI